jgi:hypothetical protein
VKTTLKVAVPFEAIEVEDKLLTTNCGSLDVTTTFEALVPVFDIVYVTLFAAEFIQVVP